MFKNTRNDYFSWSYTSILRGTRTRRDALEYVQGSFRTLKNDDAVLFGERFDGLTHF